jgi:ABC-2 type transport system ATP-binding protein
MSLVLQIENLNVRLSGTTILEDIGFNVEAGALLRFTGRNGAGKSTLLRAIAGLIPFTGEVLVGGAKPGTLAAKRQTLFVPDEAALYEDLTVLEHAQFVARLYEQPNAEAQIQVWLEKFFLTNRLKDVPSEFSRGMRQKLSISLALGLEAPLLMLDEPFNALDQEAQITLGAALEARAEAGGCVLFSAHQLDLPMQNASVLALENGRLLE